MKRDRSEAAQPDMRAEFSFKGGTRGKYSDRFTEGSNVVVLDPDVAEAFPMSKKVNDALRSLAANPGDPGE